MSTILATRLANLRKEMSAQQGRRISAQEVADAVGISRSTLAGYETAHGAPGRETLMALASFYGVSTDYIAGTTDLVAALNQQGENFAHDPDEAYLLGIWRRLDVAQKASWLNLLKSMIQSSSS